MSSGRLFAPIDLTVVERSRTNPMLAEDYLVREHPGEGDDPTAPSAAGGAL